jgi:hypothetical protein
MPKPDKKLSYIEASGEGDTLLLEAVNRAFQHRLRVDGSSVYNADFKNVAGIAIEYMDGSIEKTAANSNGVKTDPETHAERIAWDGKKNKNNNIDDFNDLKIELDYANKVIRSKGELVKRIVLYTEISPCDQGDNNCAEIYRKIQKAFPDILEIYFNQPYHEDANIRASEIKDDIRGAKIYFENFEAEEINKELIEYNKTAIEEAKKGLADLEGEKKVLLEKFNKTSFSDIGFVNESEIVNKSGRALRIFLSPIENKKPPLVILNTKKEAVGLVIVNGSFEAEKVYFKKDYKLNKPQQETVNKFNVEGVLRVEIEPRIRQWLIQNGQTTEAGIQLSINTLNEKIEQKKKEIESFNKFLIELGVDNVEEKNKKDNQKSEKVLTATEIIAAAFFDGRYTPNSANENTKLIGAMAKNILEDLEKEMNLLNDKDKFITIVEKNLKLQNVGFLSQAEINPYAYSIASYLLLQKEELRKAISKELPTVMQEASQERSRSSFTPVSNEDVRELDELFRQAALEESLRPSVDPNALSLTTDLSSQPSRPPQQQPQNKNEAKVINELKNIEEDLHVVAQEPSFSSPDSPTAVSIRLPPSPGRGPSSQNPNLSHQPRNQQLNSISLLRHNLINHEQNQERWLNLSPEQQMSPAEKENLREMQENMQKLKTKIEGIDWQQRQPPWDLMYNLPRLIQRQIWIYNNHLQLENFVSTRQNSQPYHRGQELYFQYSQLPQSLPRPDLVSLLKLRLDIQQQDQIRWINLTEEQKGSGTGQSIFVVLEHEQINLNHIINSYIISLPQPLQISLQGRLSYLNGVQASIDPNQRLRPR